MPHVFLSFAAILFDVVITPLNASSAESSVHSCEKSQRKKQQTPPSGKRFLFADEARLMHMQIQFALLVVPF